MKPGRSTAVTGETVLTSTAVIKSARCDDARVYALLSDGREVSIPLSWSSRLSDATPAQRARYSVEDFGMAIHWPDVDEDIGLATFLGVSEDVLYDALGFKTHR